MIGGAALVGYLLYRVLRNLRYGASRAGDPDSIERLAHTICQRGGCAAIPGG